MLFQASCSLHVISDIKKFTCHELSPLNLAIYFSDWVDHKLSFEDIIEIEHFTLLIFELYYGYRAHDGSW